MDPLLPQSGATKVLPTWWLALQQSALVPAGLTFSLVCSIILPSEVAHIVPAASKGQALGQAAMMGAVAQLLQPVFGAMSDRMRTKSLVCGRRRWFIIVSQLLTVAALAVMALAAGANGNAASAGSGSTEGADEGRSYRMRFWLLAAGYTGFQVANCMFCGPMGAIIPELVPQQQQTASGAWNSFFNSLAGVAASLLGIAYGQGTFSANATYAILGGLNILGLVLGVMAFGAQPGCCELEAAPPPAPQPTTPLLSERQLQQHGETADTSSSGGGGRRCGCSRELVAFFQPFCHTPFLAMFIFLFLQTITATVGVYFTQYYLADVVACSHNGFRLIGLGHKPVVESAESATAIINMSLFVAQVCFSLVGDPLSRCCGKRVLISVTSVVMALGYMAYGLVDDFSPVFAASVLIGVCAGLSAPCLYAMIADALPDVNDSGKDFNLVTSAVTVSSIVVPPLCGWALDVLKTTHRHEHHGAHHANGGGGSSSAAESMMTLMGIEEAAEASVADGCGGDSKAYLVIWGSGAVVLVLSLPLLWLVPDPAPVGATHRPQTKA